MKFKIGDVVTCVDDSGWAWIVTGRRYVVHDVSTNDAILRLADVVLPTGYRPYFSTSRFRLADHHLLFED